MKELLTAGRILALSSAFLLNLLCSYSAQASETCSKVFSDRILSQIQVPQYSVFEILSGIKSKVRQEKALDPLVTAKKIPAFHRVWGDGIVYINEYKPVLMFEPSDSTLAPSILEAKSSDIGLDLNYVRTLSNFSKGAELLINGAKNTVVTVFEKGDVLAKKPSSDGKDKYDYQILPYIEATKAAVAARKLNIKVGDVYSFSLFPDNLRPAFQVGTVESVEENGFIAVMKYPTWSVQRDTFGYIRIPVYRLK